MNGWIPVKKSRPCPVCGGDSWCTVSADGNVALCARIEEGCMTRCDGTKCAAKNGNGWFHNLTDRNGGKGAKRPPRKPIPDNHLTAAECKTMQKGFETALSPDRLKELAENLKLPENALVIYGLGFEPETRLWTFPMFDGQRRVCGFRTRDRDGNKRSIAGSRNGIFIPKDYDEPGGALLDPLDDRPLLLLLPEGPTDAAAAYSIGFRAVGRPSNMGGQEQIKMLLEKSPRQDVIIIADHDPVKRLKDGTPFVPGWEGALHLANAILPVCGTLKIVRMPGETKDFRKWVNAGGEHEIFDRLTHDADLITRKVLNEKMAKLDAWKKAGRAKWQKEQAAQVRANPLQPAADGMG